VLPCSDIFHFAIRSNASSITPLFSPPHPPPYNATIEAGKRRDMRAIVDRTATRRAPMSIRIAGMNSCDAIGDSIMAALMTFEDDNGNLVGAVKVVHHQYLLPDGSRMYVNVSPAWCRTCKKLVEAESFLSPDEMAHHARQVSAEQTRSALFPTHVLSKCELPTVTKELHDAAQWRLVLQSRQSPPKCLRCGCTDFVLILECRSWVQHPSDPKRRIRIKDELFADLAESPSLYDTEGNRIIGRNA
jgi:hypothetical protein